jgi:hypothetical protein
MATGTPKAIGPWPIGMNNRAPDYALPTNQDGNKVALRNAVNVNIDNRGYLSRRDGFTRVTPAVGAHSGYSCAGGTFFVDGHTLKLLNDDDTASDVCSVHGPVAYEYFDGVLYFSDGIMTRKLLANGTLTRWGYDVPSAPLMGSSYGVLPKGTYLAALTYLTPDGIEHGASELSSITVTTSSSIQFIGLPQRGDATLRLYLSTVNGKTLYHVGDTTAGSFTVYTDPGSGAALDKQFIDAPPAGSIIRQYKGRMYVADGKVLWYSEPFAFSHFRLANNYIQFEHDIAVIEAVDAGVWIATTDKTFLLSGETRETPVIAEQVSYGAVPGTSLIDRATGNAMWYSTRGAVTGRKDGQLVNMQEDNVAADTGTSGAAMLREHNGIKQFVASVQNSTVSPLAASSFIEMEVIRKAG